jgi:hypothetical protein
MAGDISQSDLPNRRTNFGKILVLTTGAVLFCCLLPLCLPSPCCSTPLAHLPTQHSPPTTTATIYISGCNSVPTGDFLIVNSPSFHVLFPALRPKALRDKVVPDVADQGARRISKQNPGRLRVWL